MILSSVAPEKHQHLVCCVYSEVTISKNSFLKNCPRRLGSLQAERWASGKYSCPAGTLEAGGAGWESSKKKKKKHKSSWPEEGCRCPRGGWQARATKPARRGRSATKPARREVWTALLSPQKGGNNLRLGCPSRVATGAGLGERFASARRWQRKGALPACAGGACACVCVCVSTHMLGGGKRRKSRFYRFFAISSPSFSPCSTFQFLLKSYHF